MKNLILIFLFVLSVSGINGQDNRTVNFPKEEVHVKNLPDKNHLWIFILAGQSNMAGRGLVEPQDTIPNPRILTINKNNEWILAKEPLHFYEPGMTGLDCGLSFAKELLQYLDESISIAVIPCAVGGSSINQWIGDSLWRNVRLLSNVKEKIEFSKEYGTIKGILWHQGEGDATSELIPLYEKNLGILFSEFRKFAGNKTLPVMMGQLGSFFVPEQEQSLCDSINAVIRGYAAKTKNTCVIETKDLGTKGDNVHFNSEAQRLMGKRFAEKYKLLIK